MKRIILLLVFTIFSATAFAQYPVPQQSATLAMNGQERANLEFVEAFWRDIVNGGNLDIATHYMPADFISRNPNIPAITMLTRTMLTMSMYVTKKKAHRA